jgi:hypothetical protein
MSAREDEFLPSVTRVMLAGTRYPLSTDGKRPTMDSNSRNLAESLEGGERHVKDSDFHWYMEQLVPRPAIRPWLRTA